MEQIKVIASKVEKDQIDILTTIETYSKIVRLFMILLKILMMVSQKNKNYRLLSLCGKLHTQTENLSVDEERLIKRLAELINIKNVEVLKLEK